MYQVNKGINIDYAETLIKDFLAEGYNLYDIVDIMQIPLKNSWDRLCGPTALPLANAYCILWN